MSPPIGRRPKYRIKVPNNTYKTWFTASYLTLLLSIYLLPIYDELIMYVFKYNYTYNVLYSIYQSVINESSCFQLNPWKYALC